jgi:replicative DNA helicase
MPAPPEPPDDFNEIFGGPPGSRSDFDKPAPVGRTPPQDNDAEQSVLGAMLLSKDAIADVVEAIRAVDFYRPAHELIFDAIVDLYGRGEPADAVTIAAHLTRRGELAKVGGAPYLHELVAGVPIAANAGYYAEIVREKAILRRLVDAGTKIAQLGYAGEGQVDDTVDRAQAEIFSVTDRRTTEDYLPLSEIMAGTLDEIEAISSHEGGLSGVPTGFADLDELTNGLQGGQMIIVAARPAIGKSTIGLDFCRSASIKHGMTSAIFSLEMSRNEITMRLLSAEARIALNHMRNGHMTDDDWSRLARKMGEVSSAPLFIDDSANLTMMEIRAKSRRLKQRHDLKLIVVDYLQLLSSGKKVESRQLEVSEFSRQIKLLAKELDVPIVAISQLNRGAEQRTDKRPLLSDLRESGCLTADTRLTRADTGAQISLGELLANDVRDIPVWALDERLKLVPRTLTHAFASGVKETFRVRLASGRTVDATASHPFLTHEGWRPLGGLAVGSGWGRCGTCPRPAGARPGPRRDCAAGRLPRRRVECRLPGPRLGLRPAEAPGRAVPGTVVDTDRVPWIGTARSGTQCCPAPRPAAGSPTTWQRFCSGSTCSPTWRLTLRAGSSRYAGPTTSSASARRSVCTAPGPSWRPRCSRTWSWPGSAPSRLSSRRRCGIGCGPRWREHETFGPRLLRPAARRRTRPARIVAPGTGGRHLRRGRPRDAGHQRRLLGRGGCHRADR